MAKGRGAIDLAQAEDSMQNCLREILNGESLHILKKPYCG